MTPYADFTYFGLLLYAVIPTILLGLFGRANGGWALLVTIAFAWIQCNGRLMVAPHVEVREVYVVFGYCLYQWIITAACLRWNSRWLFYLALVLSSAPLAVAKYAPVLRPDHTLGMLGISYVTFRALDLIFSIKDRVITAAPAATFLAYLLFFPTVSSGPVDRFRRFSQDWQRRRNRAEFLDDLDVAVQHLFRGFLYKFIIAALIFEHGMKPHASGSGLHVIAYMYAYTFYLFFDFAGYSAFAIALSHLYGVKTPENFNQPFLAPNIRDFWNRWHISLSFWFRDHIYMRFLLAAAKGRWFANKHTASYVGLFLTFGLMGVWHGTEWYYLLYGVYHAALLSGYDWFARWNKTRNWLSGGRVWPLVNILLTFHFVAFGLLIFSGRLAPRKLPAREEIVEKLTCYEISGCVWNHANPDEPAKVFISMDGQLIGEIVADQFRADLLEKGCGNGRHGFTFQLPATVRDGREHWIVALTAGAAEQMPGPYVIKCPSVKPAPALPD